MGKDYQQRGKEDAIYYSCTKKVALKIGKAFFLELFSTHFHVMGLETSRSLPNF